MKRQRASDKADRAAWDHLAGAPGARLDRASVMKEAADLIGERFVNDAAPVSQPTVSKGAPPIALGPVYQMLAGYALEALLKGIIVARNPDVVQQSRLRKDFVTHDFDKLLDLAGLDLDEPGKDFLRRLGDAVVWVGKYPVSIDADRMQRLTRYSTSDLLFFKHLWDLFMKALQIVMQRPVARRPGGADS